MGQLMTVVVPASRLIEAAWIFRKGSTWALCVLAYLTTQDFMSFFYTRTREQGQSDKVLIWPGIP